MLVPFAVGAAAVILTYLSRDRQNGWGLKAAFFVIFVFLALRYDYGNDYMPYLERFLEITSNVEIAITEMGWEPGWIFLHVLFKPFGFFALVMFTSLLTCVVFYRFIRNYVPAPYQWLAVFLYAFDPYQILVPASAMRQNMGILLSILGIDLLYKKRYLLYLALAAAASTFHKSGFLLFVVPVLALLNFRLNKAFAVGFVGLFAALFIFGHILVPFAFQAGGRYLESYVETYAYGLGARQAALTTGVGFFYNLFLLSAILYFAGIEMAAAETEQSEQADAVLPDLTAEEIEQYQADWPVAYAAVFPDVYARRLLFKFALVSFLFIPLGFQAAMIGRFGMYFTPTMVAVYPIIAYTTQNKFFKLVFLGTLIPYTLFRFWAFFYAPGGWGEKFGRYQTIFSAPQWY